MERYRLINMTSSAKKRADKFANFVGKNVISFENPRVVSPPGVIRGHNRRNIIVATPTRSGTHILIDLILNSFPDYCNIPLYVSLDKIIKRDRFQPGLLDTLRPDSGYVVKTHFPIGVAPTVEERARVARLASDAVVVTVRRKDADIIRSLSRFNAKGVETKGVEERFAANIAAFWEFWEDRATIGLDFDDLFTAEAYADALDRLADLTGTQRPKQIRPPLHPSDIWRIYFNKLATRILGCRAPRIDTTIYTLKN